MAIIVKPINLWDYWNGNFANYLILCYCRSLSLFLFRGSVFPPAVKEAWTYLRQASVHYMRAYQISNITFDEFAVMAKAGHKAIFNYARRAEALFGPTICTYNLHTLVCRGYKQELQRGPTSREAEFWLERKIQDLKQRVKYRAKPKAEVVLVNHL